MSERAPRVAVVGACPYPVPQGSQVYLRECARAAQLAGADLRLVVYGYGIGESDEPFPVHRSANPFRAAHTAAGPALQKPVLDVALLHTLRRVVREEGIDVVAAHNYEALIVALASGCRPIVYHPHNAMADELPHYTAWKPSARRFGAWLDKTFPRRADAIVAPHARLVAYLVECGCDPARVEVVPPPMTIVPKLEARERVASPAIVYAGNLDAYQNLALLERVAGIVRAHSPEARFVIATASQRAVDWAEMVRVDGIDNLYALLSEDVIFVCPRVSWSGYPIKLLNAMNAGAPIVCSASAAHGISDGVDGVVVPDGDAGAMAGGIIRLMQDSALRDRLGTAARERLEREHSPRKVGERLTQMYRNVVSNRSGATR